MLLYCFQLLRTSVATQDDITCLAANGDEEHCQRKAVWQLHGVFRAKEVFGRIRHEVFQPFSCGGEFDLADWVKCALMLFCRSPVVLEQRAIVKVLLAFMAVRLLMLWTGSPVVLRRPVTIEIDLAGAAICRQIDAVVFVVRLSRVLVHEISIAAPTPSADGGSDVAGLLLTYRTFSGRLLLA